MTEFEIGLTDEQVDDAVKILNNAEFNFQQWSETALTKCMNESCTRRKNQKPAKNSCIIA